MTTKEGNNIPYPRIGYIYKTGNVHHFLIITIYPAGPFIDSWKRPFVQLRNISRKRMNPISQRLRKGIPYTFFTLLISIAGKDVKK
jgi:hypothetical protein